MKSLWKFFCTLIAFGIILAASAPHALANNRQGFVSEKSNPLTLPPGFEQRKKANWHGNYTLASYPAVKNQNYRNTPARMKNFENR